MKIDKNIPVPEKVANKYPFAEMKVGDSIEVNTSTNTVSTAARQWTMYQKKEWKWSVRKQDNGSVRIWRTE